MKSFKNVDEYIESAPEEAREKLKELYCSIKKELPEVEEAISYGMPTLTLNGKFVVYFAGFKDHIGIYPASDAMAESIPEISDSRTGNGTLQFPLDKPGMKTPHVVTQVENLEKSMEAVKKAGGKIEGEPKDIPGIGMYVSFIDSEDNRVGMLQPTR